MEPPIMPAGDSRPAKSWLPPIGTPRYHLLLASVAIFILGPLGGISAAYMNFSIGFFIGGQVLAGILGSAVTYGYGVEGKHGANYIQTMSASVAGMCAMGVLIQAMTWLGLPQPPVWQLVLYFLCIGMFGVGVGMLYTPILVDRMQLTFPSGYAVANILRALTDKTLLKRSIAKLGSGMLGGYLGGVASLKVASIGSLGISTSTIGAGMVVGARITIPALMVGVVGYFISPWLCSIGWLKEGEPYRKIGFIIALGTILGAALVDISLILIEFMRRLRQKSTAPAAPVEDWKKVNTSRLLLWVLFWGTGVVVVGSSVLHQPVFFLVIAVLLVFLFAMVNGISIGISDSNPISSAFVMTVFILASIGLKDAGVGLMCASIMLIACSVGGDMQQDRSTGWRLGTNRVNQFRYQVIGIFVGALLAVALAEIFMESYPILREDTFTNPNLPGAEKWQSAMTYKFVGALKGITDPKPYIMKALALGIGLGLVMEIIRKLVKRSPAYQRFARSRKGSVADFLFDAVIVPSPYASSFGGFLELLTVIWWGLGGIIGSLVETFSFRRAPKPGEADLPPDMSTTSLVGGGLIAGDSLAALTIGIYGLLHTLFKG